jgi:crotonobetainyl-CoA:carnitine CoA-transferase CaiB-like acyl-CoA transferase
MESEFAKFFLKHTKVELYSKALQSGVMLCPLCTVEDIVENSQLQARDYWASVEHPEFESAIKCPGAFFKASQTPWRVIRPAPLIGEHNKEIYEDELRLSSEEMCMLKEAGII